MDWFSTAYVLEAGSSNSWPWFYWLLAGDLCFLAILFTMDISVTRPPLRFRCKGSLLSTSTLLQVKSSFSGQATRQDSLRGKLHPFIWASRVDESNTPRCASPGVTSSEPTLSLHVVLQSMWSTNASLFTHIHCVHGTYFDRVFFFYKFTVNTIRADINQSDGSPSDWFLKFPGVLLGSLIAY